MKNAKLVAYLKIILNLVLAILTALFLMFVLPKIIKFFLPFVIGWIVAMIANPMVRFLEKRVKLLRKHSSAITILLVIVAIVGVATLLIIVMIREAKGLISDLPTILDNAKRQLDDVTLYVKRITSALPDSGKNAIDNIINGIQNSITDLINKKQPFTMSGAGNLVGNIAEGFLMVIVTILSAYFFAAGRDELTIGLKKTLPDSVINYWRLIYDNFMKAFGGYFKAQFKIMLVLTLIMFIGFEILHVGYSFLIAFGIAFLDLLPVFGTGAILWPWALLDVISGNYFRAVGLIILYLICQIVKQILQPKMVGDSIGLHPLTTLVFMYVGYKLYSVFGMIIGIPIGMVLVNMYRIGIFDRLIKGFKLIANDINEFRKF